MMARWLKLLHIPAVALSLRATVAANKKSGAIPAAVTDKAAPTNVNGASAAQLETLPEIGTAYTGKLAARQPYKGKNELVQKKVVPVSTYPVVKEWIVAGQK